MGHPAGHSAVGDSEADLSIIVPTYKEVENLPHLIERIAQVRRETGLKIQLLLMDDDSADGSAELVSQRPEPWATLVVRRGERGLSAAVLEGMRSATGEILLCMDADLSHPPEQVLPMMAELRAGADFVFGSRYVKGGSTVEGWSWFRWLNSKVATWLARPLTNARDPMSGFFALKRDTFSNGQDIDAIGYKIGLELMVKCGCTRVAEVPIRFEKRLFGRSKLTLRQQVLYLEHLRRLYLYRFGGWRRMRGRPRT
jgi:dolichol-phosphate mannosyltransferase